MRAPLGWLALAAWLGACGFDEAPEPGDRPEPRDDGGRRDGGTGGDGAGDAGRRDGGNGHDGGGPGDDGGTGDGGAQSGTGGAGAGGSGGNGGNGGSGGSDGPGPCEVDNGGCHALVACSVEDGQVTCGACPAGLEDPVGDGTDCRDIDECARGEHECAPEATCVNEFEGYDCHCPAGYVDVDGDGRDCEDIDECALGSDDCDRAPAATCTNVPGGFLCACPAGYADPDSTGGGGECTDIDECATATPPCDDAPAATCANTEGSYTCTCPAGYADPTTGGADCRDVDECAMGSDDCDDAPAATCTNTTGSYTCTCPAGYADPTTGGADCRDVDECAMGSDDCDDAPAALCANTTGSYTCTCPSGYADPTTFGRNCQSIDECTLDTDTCDDSPNACVELPAGYDCVCPAGYNDTFGNGSFCNDVNECTLGTDDCDDPPRAICTNLPGGHSCACARGYYDVYGDGTRCEHQFGRLTTGEQHTCALLDNGDVRCWGYNWYGQLGLGDQNFRAGMPSALPRVELGRAATALSAGCHHTCALLDNGAVKCWGENDIGQLGLGDVANRGDGPGEMGTSLPAVSLGGPAVAIGVGCKYSCALLASGALKCWGENAFGQLGLGDVEDRGDEPGEMGSNLGSVALGGSAIVQFAAGYRFGCALLANGAVKCWGRNASGQLGQGDVDARGDEPGEMGAALAPIDLGLTGGVTVTQVSAGLIHTCALLSNGAVKCWGGGLGGRLGNGSMAGVGDTAGEMGSALAAINLNGASAHAVSAGNHTCVVLSSGALKCWGPNNDGQLGLGDVEDRGDEPNELGAALPTVNLGSGRTALGVDAETHTCAMLDDGAVKCWGGNQYGQLGVGDTSSRGDAPGEMGDALPVALDLF